MLADYYSNLGWLYFKLGNIDNAKKNANSVLIIDSKNADALSLLGRIEIENKKYNAAIKHFQNAIESGVGKPMFFIWHAYAKFLHAEFSLSDKGKNVQEEMLSIIRNLEKAKSLSKEGNKEIKSYILYFLGGFYLKIKDIHSAKDKLEECIQLNSKSPIDKPARKLLNDIWNNKIRPPLWLWWLNSPINKMKKRWFFIITSFLIAGLLTLHPVIDNWVYHCLNAELNWNLYTILIFVLIVLIFLPKIERIKAKEVEIELHVPSPFEMVMSPIIMEEKLKEMEKNNERNQ